MTSIGRYQIKGELGRGAMGVVYAALDPAIGRQIAIKTIRLSDLQNVQERIRLRDRLFREAQSAGVLSHPFIVTIYDVIEEDGLAYIFMEFVNGPPLEELLRAYPLPPKPRFVGFLRQAAAALDYAHRKGIVHRDIKPGNIMIHEEETVKITDFGIAKVMSQQMTQTGTMMGTPNYMSPEQIQGSEISGASDQFSLAVIAYEILTGKRPFEAEALPTLLFRICKNDPTAPHLINPTLSAKVEAVFQRAMAKDPQDRYPSCTDFVTDLELSCDLSPGWVVGTPGAWDPLRVTTTSGRSTTGGGTASGTLSAPVPTSEPEPPPAPTPAPAPVLPSPVSKPTAATVDWNSTVAQAPVSPAPPVTRETGRKRFPAAALTVALVLVLGGIGVLLKSVLSRPAAKPTPEPVAEAAASPLPSAPEKPQPAPVVPPSAPAAPPPSNPAPATVGRAPAPVTASVRSPAKARKAEPPKAPRQVHIETKPPGARISAADGTPANCVSPCVVVLTDGTHSLQASLEGYRNSILKVELPRDQNLKIDLSPLVGSLGVTTIPPGATILLDGKPRAERTPALFQLPAGSYRLQVVKGENKSYEETVVIHDGVVIRRTFDIQ